MPKNTTAKQVEGVLDKLSSRRDALEAAQSARPHWKTSCRLELPGWEPINIPIAQRVDILAFAIGQLTRLKSDMGKLKLKPAWDNYPVSAWIADLKARIGVLSTAAELNRVRSMESAARPLLTEDQKRERKLAALLSQMSDLGL